VFHDFVVGDDGSINLKEYIVVWTEMVHPQSTSTINNLSSWQHGDSRSANSAQFSGKHGKVKQDLSLLSAPPCIAKRDPFS
jgi:hypothetical protein